MSFKRDTMTRKRPTQVELEHQVSELKKQVQQLQKRLKQTLRQLRDHEDIAYNAQAALDLEQEVSFQDMLAGHPQPEDDSEYFIITLPNGIVKKLKKRVMND
jgi:predicted  nucleic acid-binding Zn-ribbon protein